MLTSKQLVGLSAVLPQSYPKKHGCVVVDGTKKRSNSKSKGRYSGQKKKSSRWSYMYLEV